MEAGTSATWEVAEPSCCQIGLLVICWARWLPHKFVSLASRLELLQAPWLPANLMEHGILHCPSGFTLILNLIIVVASYCSGLNWLTTYYGCISLFCHLKMCVSCSIQELKGLVMSRRWVRLSRERWPLILKFDVLEMLLSKYELWYGFPRECVDSEKRFQTNGTERMTSYEYRAWHLLSQTQPHRTFTLLLKDLLLSGARPMSLSERFGSFVIEPPPMQAHLDRSLIWKLFISQTGTLFENERRH